MSFPTLHSWEVQTTSEASDSSGGTWPLTNGASSAGPIRVGDIIAIQWVRDVTETGNTADSIFPPVIQIGSRESGTFVADPSWTLFQRDVTVGGSTWQIDDTAQVVTAEMVAYGRVDWLITGYDSTKDVGHIFVWVFRSATFIGFSDVIASSGNDLFIPGSAVPDLYPTARDTLLFGRIEATYPDDGGGPLSWSDHFGVYDNDPSTHNQLWSAWYGATWLYQRVPGGSNPGNWGASSSRSYDAAAIPLFIVYGTAPGTGSRLMMIA